MTDNEPVFVMPPLQSAACDGKPLSHQLAMEALSRPSNSPLCVRRRAAMACPRSMGSTLPWEMRTASS